MSRKQQQTDSASKLAVIDQVERLAQHFKSPQDEGQIKIFVDALQSKTVYQIQTAFDRCLNECEFMPKLVNVRERMPEQRYPPENPGKFVVRDKPILDEVRAIVLEMYPDYWKLDTIEDKHKIHDLFAAANRERYRRMGIDPDNFRARKAKA